MYLKSKYMRRLLFAFLLMQCSSVFSMDDAYCDGFTKGFSQRYCLLIGKTDADALPPVCPEPLLGAESAQDGYNRGFLMGLNAARMCQEEDESEQGFGARIPEPVAPGN